MLIAAENCTSVKELDHWHAGELRRMKYVPEEDRHYAEHGIEKKYQHHLAWIKAAQSGANATAEANAPETLMLIAAENCTSVKELDHWHAGELCRMKYVPEEDRHYAEHDIEKKYQHHLARIKTAQSSANATAEAKAPETLMLIAAENCTTVKELDHWHSAELRRMKYVPAEDRHYPEHDIE